MTLKIIIWLLFVLLFSCQGNKKLDEQYLQTADMEEADFNSIQFVIDPPIVIDASLVSSTRRSADSVPWANLYYCITSKKDTVLILDTLLSRE